MATDNMPAAEVSSEVYADERMQYELAFHVLPTVAEGEVAGVFETLKKTIIDKGGECAEEEAPERIDLAYDIVENIEGKHRAYHSAYFGWVRFSLQPELIAELTEAVQAMPEILRQLCIRLSRVEAGHPFFYHESRKEKKTVTVGDEEVLVNDATIETKTEEETSAEVSESELDESLEKITTEKTEAGETSEGEVEKKD